jgi:hypothetical protein
MQNKAINFARYARRTPQSGAGYFSRYVSNIWN